MLYGPNADTPGFYAGLKNKLLSLDGIPLIICGDWNMVLDYNKDTHGYVRENNSRARKEVQSMINTLELVDIWRANNPHNRKYAWVSSKRPIKMARLDFFLVSSNIHAQTITAPIHLDTEVITLSMQLKSI